jgi:hypothetical protein
MPRITIETVHANGEPHRSTLSERIIADNLANDHYADHLIQRLSWAVADAEAIESQSPDARTDGQNEPRRARLQGQSRNGKRSRSRPVRASARVRA